MLGVKMGGFVAMLLVIIVVSVVLAVFELFTLKDGGKSKER